MKNLLIILSILLLSSPLFGQSTPKYESVGQCVLQMMTEKKLTGNEMFELVKKECQRILGKVGVKGKKRQKGVLYGRSVNGKWGWYGLGDEEKDSKYVGKTKNGKPNGQGTYTWSSGNKYVGEFKDGKKHGQGKMILPDGKKYVGEYKDGPMWN